nr:MAG TPA: hypothetical protein [Caudoviricetes sp.]
MAKREATSACFLKNFLRHWKQSVLIRLFQSRSADQRIMYRLIQVS